MSMPTSTPDGLTTLLAHLDCGDTTACAAQLVAAAPAERRRWAPEVRRVFEAAREGAWETEGSSSRWRVHGTEAQRDATMIALLGTATHAELVSLRTASIPAPAQWEPALALVRALRPAWLPEWATLLCELSAGGWPLARRLVREGLSDKPLARPVHCRSACTRSRPKRAGLHHARPARGCQTAVPSRPRPGSA